MNASEQVCNLRRFDVKTEPFAHVFRESFIEPELYRQLQRTFPSCHPGKSPTGYSLYWGEPDYQRLLEAELAWQALFDTFHSQAFIEWGAAQFAEEWRRGKCKINPEEARYVPYREDRIDKERATLRKIVHEPQELWVRMDIHQGRLGYSRPVHLDHARRLISMLVYFCDHTENQMSGGELFLHGPDSDVQNPTRIVPRHNTMVAFPCSNDSQHSVSKITAAAAPRNYIQVHISSSVDIWEREEISRPLWRRVGSSLKRRLNEFVNQ